MATLPRLVVTAEHREGDFARPLGSLDLTRSVAGLVTRSPVRLEQWAGGQGPLVMDIGRDIPESMRQTAYGGHLSLPDFTKKVQEWAEEAGGPEGMAEINRLLEAETDALYRLERAEAELDRVRQASWQQDATNYEMLYSESFPDDYAQDAESGLSSWGWDSFVRQYPRPDVDFGTPQAQAWDEAYAAWQRGEAPPYAWATVAVPWEGVLATDIRQNLADEGSFDLSSLMESSLEDHYEDAYESVVDEDALWAFMTKWEALPHDGFSQDMELETFLAGWNARQTIVSYEWDKTTLVPMFPDATHAEALQWCERRVDKARAALEGVRDAWQSPAVACVPAL